MFEIYKKVWDEIKTYILDLSIAFGFHLSVSAMIHEALHFFTVILSTIVGGSLLFILQKNAIARAYGFY
jgi:hypothetical protein